MSETGEANAKKDTLASGAQPRPEGPVRERGWRPTRRACGSGDTRTEAVRRRAIAAADTLTPPLRRTIKEAAACAHSSR